jgi:hypothetical protein
MYRKSAGKSSRKGSSLEPRLPKMVFIPWRRSNWYETWRIVACRQTPEYVGLYDGIYACSWLRRLALMVTKRDHRSASHTTKSIASSLAIHWPRPACGINEIAPDIRRAVKDARGEHHVMQSRSSRRSGQPTGAIALIRGGYNGQRSCERRLQPEHMAAPTKPANVKKALADSEVSTNGTGLSAPISQRPRSWRR